MYNNLFAVVLPQVDNVIVPQLEVDGWMFPVNIASSCVIGTDPLNTIVLHAYQEAAQHLRVVCVK